MAHLLHRLGAFSARRRRTVLTGWLVFFVVLGGLTVAFKGTFTTEFKIPGTESQNAAELVSERIPGTNPNNASGTVVFAAKSGQKVTSGERKAAIEESVAALAKVPKVASAGDPYETKAVSEDGRIAYSSVAFAANPQDITEEETAAIERATEAATKAGLQVEYGGSAAAVEAEAPIGEIVGIAVALVVLAITFGSLLAAGLPILTGVLGVGVGALGITLASGFTDLADTSITIAAMLGLAVGIDYTLFILSRHRTQVADGMEIEASIAKAVGTAGSAVVFAGATVIIALVGLTVTGVPFLAQMGLGAAFTILFAVLLSLTMTPALLAFAGHRAVKGKTFTEDAHDETSDARPTMGARWIAFVVRRRVAAIAVVGLALVALAIPALNMRLGLPGDGDKGPATTERKAYDLLSDGFGPGFNGPLTVVADLQGVQDPQAVAAATAKDLGGLDDVATAAPPVLSPKKDLAIIQLTPSSGPSATATEDLVQDIRGEAGAIERDSGAKVAVTGQTATNIDISQRMSDSLIPYLAVVVGLALVLLLIAFRSILVPLTAIAGFLLTIVASFGVVTLIFQEGVGASLIGVSQTGPLVSLLPILIIGVIFGLAMDYQVFLVSRMREEHAHGASAQDAVRDGFRHSARVVTAAGLIMISVFAGFILPTDPIVKSIGVAFATGILIDAFLVRMTLIPALMSVMGERAWWMPRWLERIVPNVDIEGTSLEKGPKAVGPASPVAGD
ncbi:MMPL family transporter [Patulibacter sp.]|uniref:MMPL family transporter n=1 Tax=Patulibacter sp. TaxID=1912859 RepID=UPI002718F2A7|nr:MMPL family transporter [Patulibacter sp.]MDO9407987.1 MMPL family transporter [Patulibacter sp.]